MSCTAITFLQVLIFLTDLEKNDVQATGRTRENRTADANQKIISSKQLQKQERECFEYCCVELFILLSGMIIQLWRLQAIGKVTLQFTKLDLVKGGVKEVPSALSHKLL